MDDEPEPQTDGDKLDKLLALIATLSERLESIESQASTRVVEDEDDTDKDKDKDKDTQRRKGEGQATRVAADAAREVRDRDARADAQYRADAVANCFGERAPPPMAGEATLAYRRRLLRQYQQHSPQFKGADLHAITDAATFDGVEAVIYADARVASATPDVPPGQLLRRERINPETGARSIEFHGTTTFISQMKRPSMRVTHMHTGRHDGRHDDNRAR